MSVFKSYPIRKNMKDAAVVAVKRFTQLNQKLAKTLGLALIAGIIFSTNFVIAAPSSNPPSSNVAPNFSAIDVDTRGDGQSPYTRFAAGKSSGNPIIRLFTRSAQTNNRFSEIEVGGANNTVRLDQNDQGSLFNRILMNTQGIVLSSTSYLFNDLSSSISISSSGVTITAPRISFEIEEEGEFFTNSFRATNVNTTGVYTDVIDNVTSGRTIYRSNILVDPRTPQRNVFDRLTYSALGVPIVGLYDKASIRAKLATSPTKNLSTGTSGTIAGGVCGLEQAATGTNTMNYGSAFSCSYAIEGDTNAQINVTPRISTDGRSCKFDWTASQATGNFFLNSTTLCAYTRHEGVN